MKLFTVGPVKMYPDTLKESADQLPYFRTPEFSEIMLESERILLELAFAPKGSRAVFLTASGTGAMEAAIMNCLNPQDHVMVIDGGSFGHRFVQMCERHRIPGEKVAVPFGTVLTREMLDKSYQSGMTALLVNIHETSTGQLYDIKMISEFCKEHGLLLIVDAISSFIADDIRMDENGIDVLILSSQKAFALAPGISNVVLSPRAVELVGSRGTDMVYFDFRDYLKNGERGQTPFTPAVGILLTMNTRLRNISQRGIENVRADIASIAADFRNRVGQLPVSIPEYPHSNALTPLYFPDKNAKKFYEILRSEYDITVTPNGGELGETLLRVGHIGNLSIDDNIMLIEAMRKVKF